jgi:hypothetical protein
LVAWERGGSPSKLLPIPALSLCVCFAAIAH